LTLRENKHIRHSLKEGKEKERQQKDEMPCNATRKKRENRREKRRGWKETFVEQS
jgi:hypothetical protein